MVKKIAKCIRELIDFNRLKVAPSLEVDITVSVCGTGIFIKECPAKVHLIPRMCSL
jgi:hypothetical protein